MKTNSDELNLKLWNAAKDGDNDAVITAIEAGANVNWKNDSKYGSTALHNACAHGHENIVLVLLQNKANPNLQTKGGQTPLHRACEKGYESTVLVLLQNKADPNLQNENGWTPLHRACEKGHESTLLVLLQNKANPNLQTKNGWTPLHKACENGHENIVLALLQIEADPNLQTKGGYTFLNIACEYGHQSIVLVLLQNGANPNLQDERGFTPLHKACEKGHENIVLVLLQNKADPNFKPKDGETPLHRACEKGHEKIVLILLQNGANPNLQTKDGETPLHMACGYGHKNIVLVLLQNGADPNLQNENGMTALHLASRNGEVDIVDTLIKNGAEKEAKDKRDRTPLLLACEGDHIEVVKLIIEKYKANINHRDKDGHTPSYMAVKEYNLDIIRYLKSNGADFTLKANDESTADILLQALNKEQNEVKGINDSAKGGVDRLGYKAYAKAIAVTIKSATPPMCVGIIGCWGSGKSFVFELVKKELDPCLRMRRDDSGELLQWFEEGYLKCQEMNKDVISSEAEVIWNITHASFQVFTESYLLAMIALLVCDDFRKCCCSKKDDYDIEAQIPLIQKKILKEYIYVSFNAWVFNKTDELWVALIRELYRVVELRLSKMPLNTNETNSKSQQNFKFNWRVEKAKALLIESYGGEDSFRFKVYPILVILLGSLVLLLLRSIGVGVILTELNQMWKIVVASLGIIPSLKLFYDANKYAATSRGDALFAEASGSIKDNVGFMEKVSKELTELFAFLKRYEKDTNIDLEIILYVDDLDRCVTNGRNVMVLEAIQLLLNIPGAPVVVFLAIDTRIIATSIEAYMGKSLNVDDAMISGHEYLEKIIQLPFCLPEPPPEKIKEFIANSIRPDKVDILFVARRLKTFLKCIKSFIDNHELNSECCLEIIDHRLKKDKQHGRLEMKFFYYQLEEYCNVKDASTLDKDRELLKKAAGLLTISTWIALQKYEAMKEVVAEEFCNSILDALSSASIVKKKKSENEVMKNGIIERVIKNQSSRNDMVKKQSNWTATLINEYKKDVKRKSDVTSILHDYNRKIERKFSTLIPTELIPFLNAFCSEVNRNPRNVKRTLNILQVIFEVVKVKTIDEDDLAVVANDDAWPELSKKLVVWILLCAAYPYRTSFIAQVVLDFDQQSRLNHRARQLHCNPVVLYGSSVYDLTIPDIEELPLAVFYAEYVEPYIYALKNAEKLLKLDGDPDDFAIILSRMLFHKGHDDDDLDELPNILCKDVLGPFIEDSSKSEYIIMPAESTAIEEKKSEGTIIDEPKRKEMERLSENEGKLSAKPIKLERPKTKDRAEYLSLLHYSFNLNPSMRRQISLELSTLTSQHDLFIKTTSSGGEKHETLTGVLDGRNIQTKKEVVMQGRKLHKVTRKKIISHDDCNAMDEALSAGDTSEVILNGRLVKPLSRDNKMPANANTRPLSELSIIDVGSLLDRLDIGEFKAIFVKHKIDGNSLVRCSTVDEVKEMGIPITVKAKLLFEQIREFQVNGVPLEYLQSSTQDVTSAGDTSSIGWWWTR